MKTTKVEIEIALMFGFLLGLLNVILMPVTSFLFPEPYRLVCQAAIGAAVSVALGFKFGFLKKRAK